MKTEVYRKLVAARKSHVFPEGLQNPSTIQSGEFDCDHIGAWSQWQHHLDANILVIGQDWGDVSYFIDNKGRDTDNNPTNKNLIELFVEIGIDIGTPSHPTPQRVFFTNAILGIKGLDQRRQMSLPVKAEWVLDTTFHFTKPLIDCIQPRIIVTLGAIPLRAIRLLYPDFPVKNLKTHINEAAIRLKDSAILFPFYHCGGLGLANRKFELQKRDWQRIREFL